MIFLGDASLRRAIVEFMDHYHEERNHQSLNNQVIVPLTNDGAAQGGIARKQRLGGMLNQYHRLAA